ncbi:uncharacterized protein LOC128888341 [Hylaeus anthracinus]|uniref:uncharacterized protein LOC128888341 n=1 Tax=Hylaeus anthracinus TaxID=313031 RepID=UPI0023B96FF6|nr:uncharacterized protein LOC128888341 [Hylaeus anthracinus]
MSKVANKSVTFPMKPPGQAKVWNVVDWMKKDSNEPPIRISIQEIPEDRYEDVLDHMCTYFIVDEPICKCMNGAEDPEYVAQFRKTWTMLLNQGLSVGAFADNPDGGKPIIAGANILGLTFEGESLEELDMHEKEKRIMVALNELCHEAGVYKRYGVDRYMSALGLSVHPSFRGAGLGYHLLKARENIGREYNIQVTSTVFTSPISQKLAARSGFEDLLTKEFKDLVDEKGELFPNITSKIVKVSAKKLY